MSLQFTAAARRLRWDKARMAIDVLRQRQVPFQMTQLSQYWDLMTSAPHSQV